MSIKPQAVNTEQVGPTIAWDRISFWGDEYRPMIYRNINFWGNIRIDNLDPEEKIKYCEHKMSFKIYLLDVLAEFNILIWPIAVPLATAIYFIQKYERDKFYRENTEYFV